MAEQSKDSDKFKINQNVTLLIITVLVSVFSFLFTIERDSRKENTTRSIANKERISVIKKGDEAIKEKHKNDTQHLKNALKELNLNTKETNKILLQIAAKK